MVIMDPNYLGFTYYTNDINLDEQTVYLNLEEYTYLETGFNFNLPSPNMNLLNPPMVENPVFMLNQGSHSLDSNPHWSPEGEGSSPLDESLSSEPVFKYITQMLMEENMEDQPFMNEDPLALKLKEKALYDEIGEGYPFSLTSSRSYVSHESSEGGISGSGSNSNGNSRSTSTSSPGADYNFKADARYSFNPPPVNELMQNIFSNRESVLQFNRGLEEARKFLPSSSRLIIDVESNPLARSSQKEVTSRVAIKEEEIEIRSLPNGSWRDRKHQPEREELETEEARSNKLSAVYNEETKNELSDMFDKVLLSIAPKGGLCNYTKSETDESSKTASKVPENQRQNKSSDGKTRGRKRGKKGETVDLRSLLILCAQAISANDCRTGNELLKQIRQHASAIGDGTQRLAHYFANGLEARLGGRISGMQNLFTSLAARRTTAADMLNAYTTFLEVCPFKKLSIFFADKAIVHSGEKASTVHIIDFGILYGFQWPILIQHISKREGGPPKLRFTGIELPQSGFRPMERIEETGRRLEKYCKQFNVPFEYNPIASQHWETIKLEDLKLRNGEFVAVNCMGRFKHLSDETTEVHCQRDAVLNLIRQINPNIFVHTIINGSYNSPFFVTRFREALFHFSSIFDIFETTLPRDDPERFLLESESFGRDLMNVAACEGINRVDRPETYKQWQVRTARAGFKLLPLNKELVNKFMEKVKEWYHKDFVMDIDGEWMLQGWKGRILSASSCWAPA